MTTTGAPAALRAEPARPGPVVTQDNAAFWEAARQRQLMVQQCRRCQQRYHPPRPMCPSCHSTDLGLLACSGRATIHSWTAVHYPQSPRFSYPAIVVVVELEEGVRLVSGLVDAQPSDVRIGLPVTVDFLDVEDGAVLPVFRLER